MEMSQEQFDSLSKLMSDKGVQQEAFEILADLRMSEKLAHDELKALRFTLVSELKGLTDYEGFPVSELNYLQVIRKLKEQNNSE